MVRLITTPQLYDHFWGPDGIDPPFEEPEFYRPGGLHPVDIGQFLDLDKRFEVCHKTDYGVDFTEWFTRDHVQQSWKLVKIFTEEVSSEDHSELALMDALSEFPPDVLRDNHIITPSEYLWIDGPNGRHLCLVFPVLGHSVPPDDFDRSHPDDLIDLCFQVAKAVALLHGEGICHGNIELKNVRMLVDMEALEEKIKTAKDLTRYMGKPRKYPLEPLKGNDPRPHGPLHVVEPGDLDNIEVIGRTGKAGLVGFDYWYEPELWLNTPRGKHASLFPLIRYPGKEVSWAKGKTGFPSDIWSLACLFGQIRTEGEFNRAPGNYGTPLSMQEIKQYLSYGSFRVSRSYPGIRQPREYYSSDEFISSDDDNDHDGDGGGGDSDSEELIKESSIGTSKEGTRDTSHQESKSTKVKRVDVPVERRITRSITRMQKSNLSTTNQAPTSEPTAINPYLNPETKSRRSSNSSSKSPTQVKPTITQSSEKRGKAVEEEVTNKENSATHTQETDTLKSSDNTSQDGGRMPASSISSKKQVFDESTHTISSTDETTQKEIHRSDILVKDDKTFNMHSYQMPEDELTLLADLLGKMLAPNPQDRPSINEVLNHEWFGNRRASLAPKKP